MDIVVRFDPGVAQRVAETRWHPSQVTETEADGSLLWRARVSGVLEIRSWLLGWGRDAEVLAPAELRDWVAAQHAAAAAALPGAPGGAVGYSALTAAMRFSRPALASAKSMPVLGFV